MQNLRVRTLTAKTSPGGVWIFEDWHKFIQFQLQTEGIAVEAGYKILTLELVKA